MTGSLPYGRHLVDEADVAAVAEVLRGDWLTTGPTLEAFEGAFATAVDAPHAVAVNSGTAALHLVNLALDVGPGDVAIVPSVTFLATANAVRMAGAEVVFADVDPGTGLMRAGELHDAITRAGRPVKAVWAVHLAGQCAEMDELRAVADEAGAVLLEDACHAVGTAYLTADGAAAPVGACRHGRAACFSLHPVKTLTMGEGGVITTRDGALARRARALRSHGMIREGTDMREAEQAFDAAGEVNPWYYEMREIGFNYRPSDLQTALGLSQLAKLEDFRLRRAALVAAYDRGLAPLDPVVRPLERTPAERVGWHLYGVRVDFAVAGITRAKAMRALREKGIGTQVHYIPVNRQPYYRERYGFSPLPGAESYYASCLSLPLFVGMVEADVDRVVRALTAVLDIPAG